MKPRADVGIPPAHPRHPPTSTRPPLGSRAKCGRAAFGVFLRVRPSQVSFISFFFNSVFSIFSSSFFLSLSLHTLTHTHSLSLSLWCTNPILELTLELRVALLPVCEHGRYMHPPYIHIVTCQGILTRHELHEEEEGVEEEHVFKQIRRESPSSGGRRKFLSSGFKVCGRQGTARACCGWPAGGGCPQA